MNLKVRGKYSRGTLDFKFRNKESCCPFTLSSALWSRPVPATSIFFFSLVISTQEGVIRHMLTHKTQECRVMGKYPKLLLFYWDVSSYLGYVVISLHHKCTLSHYGIVSHVHVVWVLLEAPVSAVLAWMALSLEQNGVLTRWRAVFVRNINTARYLL